MSHLNTMLYLGVTSNLIQRIYQPKKKLVKGFSTQYGLTKRVYFERWKDMENAIVRENRLKHWNLQRKNKLISEVNSD
nr:GIY-YIG nuclease family protein [Salinimonas chungwhensis]